MLNNTMKLQQYVSDDSMCAMFTVDFKLCILNVQLLITFIVTFLHKLRTHVILQKEYRAVNIDSL